MNEPTFVSMSYLRRYGRWAIAALIVAVFVTGVPDRTAAQIEPDQRQRRTYIPPEQLVSFSSNTPIQQFISAINPIMEQVMGKTVVDPADRSGSIGVPIAGMYFLDALEVVLQQRGLTYRETDQYLIIEEPSTQAQTTQSGAQNASAGSSTEVPATARTREIESNAIFFELNLSKARELGINWTEVFGSGGSGTGQGGTGTGGGGTGGTSASGSVSSEGLDFQLKIDQFVDQVDEYVTGPDQVGFGTLTRIFRVFERENIGETVANPSITVQSGEQGQIQIGSDIPIQIRDFAGNTTTEFVETGVIVDVEPTLLTDTVQTAASDTQRVEFIHLQADVQKSSGSPSPSGTVITKSQAETEALLLDEEQTVIGGLYSTEKSEDRKGIPLLKDLPKWFFGLRYVFGFTQTRVTRKELLMVLQAEIRDPLPVRARQSFPDDLMQRERQEFMDRLRRSGGSVERYRRDYRLPAPEMPAPRDD